MKIKNTFKAVMTMIAMTSLVACGGGGGGGGTSTGGYYYTHAELAQDFVYRLNADLGYDVTLVKTNTLQSDYIVVYDYDYDTYDAYDLRYYNPGENMGNYIATYQSNFYYDLDDLSGNLYEDYYTGVQFNQTEMTSHDREKAAALVEHIQVSKAKEVLTTQFGLGEKRSLEIAKLAVSLNAMDKDSMSDADYNEFAQEIVGQSIDKFKSAVIAKAEGNEVPFDQALELAAEKNNTTVEHMKQIADMLLQ